MALTKRAHHWLRTYFTRREMAQLLAVDATCGNGLDTEFLCSLGFDNVIAFDIQADAIKATKKRIAEAGYANTSIIQADHSQLDLPVPTSADCVMFNLGYLPHGDKRITTRTDSTIRALEYFLRRLSVHGVLTVLCYPGHPEGARETAAVRSLMASLNSNYQVEEMASDHANDYSPVLFLVSNQ